MKGTKKCMCQFIPHDILYYGMYLIKKVLYCSEWYRIVSRNTLKMGCTCSKFSFEYS